VIAELLLLKLMKTLRDLEINKLTPQNQSPFLQNNAEFTTLTHNTCLDSLNKHLCCDLQRIARSHQAKKSGFSPSVATLPELL
jgi:hypothetical protein